MTNNGTAPGLVLVVDDEEKNLRLIGTILKSYGYQFATAVSGPEALEKAAAAPPDLIYLDVMMPQMNGYEVCQRLKGNPLFAGAGGNLAITRILAEAFVKDHPGVVIEIPASIGSTGGRKAAAEGAVTLGLTARPLRDGEKSMNLSQVPYARTIIVIGVHPAVGDMSLT